MMHEHFLPNLLAEVIGATVMGFLVVLMLVAGFKFFDKMLPGIDFDTNNGCGLGSTDYYVIDGGRELHVPVEVFNAVLRIGMASL